jgi:hypothetical protein
MAHIEAMAEASFADNRERKRSGTVRAAIVVIIATTIINSINVKPYERIFIRTIPLTKHTVSNPEKSCGGTEMCRHSFSGQHY